MKRSANAVLVLMVAGCAPDAPADSFTTGGGFEDRQAVREIIETARQAPAPPPCSTPADFADPTCQRPDAWRGQAQASTGAAPSSGGHSSFIFIHSIVSDSHPVYTPSPPRPISYYAARPSQPSWRAAATARAQTMLRTVSSASTARWGGGAPAFSGKPSVTTPSPSALGAMSRGGFGAAGAAVSSSASS